MTIQPTLTMTTEEDGPLRRYVVKNHTWCVYSLICDARSPGEARQQAMDIVHGDDLGIFDARDPGHDGYTVELVK